ncbi:MAG: prephenate dehydrogenase/arogenate dehydrogenase family protein [Planctomycetales bacterium]|nr:prephenate dehydrogenase/arogenate dehydrogenase family protein [Planctomycetales bacterium]
MPQFQKIAIIGVGLIGASIGLAVRKRRLAAEVVGIGRRTSSLRKAKNVGAVDRTTTKLASGVQDADLAIVCTPVGAIAEIVAQVAAAAPNCLITDAGSTKEQLVAEIESRADTVIRFVGSHPLAGAECSGPEHGQADLFKNRTVVVTPTSRTALSDKETITKFWKKLGAQIVELTPAKHDEALAATSHLPHLAAAAIAASTPERYLQLVATGWADTTRIAAGDADLWRQIFFANRSHVLAAMDTFEGHWKAFRLAIELGDGDKLTTLLTEAKRIRDALGN